MRLLPELRIAEKQWAGEWMDSAETFWSARFDEAGHTGWNDPIFYAYDQLERLGLVDSQLREALPRGAAALDFGCGSGDFSKLLLGRGFRVTGYDPFVRPPLADPRFDYMSSLQELAVREPSFDLILSVTVLDHVLDSGDLKRILDLMRRSLRDGGRLLMLEYALDCDSRPASAYQAFRSLDEWREILSRSGWKLAESRPVPHPEEAPSAGYVAYSGRPTLRFAQRLRHRLPGVHRWMAPSFDRLARREFARFGVGQVERSPLKLLLCERAD